MFMINLCDLGPVPPFLATPADLQHIYAAAEEIYSTTGDEELGRILDSWEQGLTWRSLDAEPVGDAWYCRALLVTCLRGLRGESAPKMWPLTPDN
jgi:hypothetical protein